MSTLLAIGMTTAPRPYGHDYANLSLLSMRRAGFDQKIHVFAEPGGATLESFPNTQLLQGGFRRGIYKNYTRTIDWLLDNTDAEYIMIVQDDVLYRTDAATRLEAAMTDSRFEAAGIISPYACRQNGPERFPGPGWYTVRGVSMGFWGGLTLCYPRRVLYAIRRHAIYRTYSQPNQVDLMIGRVVRALRCKMWSHFPSLADHFGTASAHMQWVAPPQRAYWHSKHEHGWRFCHNADMLLDPNNAQSQFGLWHYRHGHAAPAK